MPRLGIAKSRAFSAGGAGDVPYRGRRADAAWPSGRLNGAALDSIRGARGLPEDAPGDDEALDLVGPLVDLRDLRVPHVLLDRVVLAVAVAPEELDRVGRDHHGHV